MRKKILRRSLFTPAIDTVPAELHFLMLANQRKLYPLVFDCVAQSLAGVRKHPTGIMLRVRIATEKCSNAVLISRIKTRFFRSVNDISIEQERPLHSTIAFWKRECYEITMTIDYQQ